METVQVISPTELEDCNSALLLEILIQEVRTDERKTAVTKRRNIKKILKEITKRLDLPKQTAEFIVERDS